MYAGVGGSEETSIASQFVVQSAVSMQSALFWIASARRRSLKHAGARLHASTKPASSRFGGTPVHRCIRVAARARASSRFDDDDDADADAVAASAGAGIVGAIGALLLDAPHAPTKINEHSATSRLIYNVPT